MHQAIKIAVRSLRIEIYTEYGSRVRGIKLILDGERTSGRRLRTASRLRYFLD